MPTILTLLIAGLGLVGAYKLGHLQGRDVGRKSAARELYVAFKQRGWVS